MARIRLRAGDEQRSYDTGVGRFTDGEQIPCFRCGVCCQRWSPLVGRVEAQRLAGYLGLPLDDFLAAYTRPYPLEEDTHALLQAADGGCVFLELRDGVAGCRVHEARPQPCRDWDASLLRKECRDGLRGAAGAAGLLLPILYDNAADAGAFVERLRTPLPAGARGAYADRTTA